MGEFRGELGPHGTTHQDTRYRKASTVTRRRKANA